MALLSQQASCWQYSAKQSKRILQKTNASVQTLKISGCIRHVLTWIPTGNNGRHPGAAAFSAKKWAHRTNCAFFLEEGEKETAEFLCISLKSVPRTRITTIRLHSGKNCGIMNAANTENR